MITNFTPNEQRFIKQLNYWIKCETYGVEHDGSIWIYNSLEDWAMQLKVSKSSIRRAIQSLKQKGIIKTSYLSENKRNRTLFYTIDYDNFDFKSIKKPCIKKRTFQISKNYKILSKNEHMAEHMGKYTSRLLENQSIKAKNECENEHIIFNTNNNINKSYKSQDSLKNDFSENSTKGFHNNKKVILDSCNKDSKSKNTTIQDMLKKLKAEFPDIPVFLNKNLARNLVAAFKLKFKNSLAKWHEFLKLVKTSTYLMSEKFRLTIQWLLKFSTIDRLFQGDLEVKLAEVFFSKTPDEEAEIIAKEHTKTSELLNEIDNSEETEKCKEIRKKLLQKLGNIKYDTWFRKKTVVTEESEGIFIDIPSNGSKFVFDYITNRFRDTLESLGLTCRETKNSSYFCKTIC